MLKAVFFLVAFLVTVPVSFAQSHFNHFVGIHYNAMSYDPLDGTIQLPRSGMGILLNRSFNQNFSIEFAYHNAWIDETNQGINYRFIAHAMAIRAGFGYQGEKWSGHVLIGPSVGHNTFGVDLGARLSSNLTERLRIFGAAVLTGHLESQFPVVSGGLYVEPMSSLLFLNLQAGLAWNFGFD